MLFYHDKSQTTICFVMLVEMPDPEIIIGIVIAFFGGLFALYAYTKIHLMKTNFTISHVERLDYYERQLIDMRIRLDALDLLGFEPKFGDNNQDLNPVLENQPKKQELEVETKSSPKKQRLPNLNSGDMMDRILGLITEKSMTSHDIQITLGRTREHVSRLMKRLYQDGLVERNIKTKPYTYSITEVGRTKLGLFKNNLITA